MPDLLRQLLHKWQARIWNLLPWCAARYWREAYKQMADENVGLHLKIRDLDRENERLKRGFRPVHGGRR